MRIQNYKKKFKMIGIIIKILMRNWLKLMKLSKNYIIIKEKLNLWITLMNKFVMMKKNMKCYKILIYF